MIWTTWRQHRSQALAGAAALAATAALAFYGDSQRAFGYSIGGLANPLMIALQLLPGLAGIFIGAPLLASELEQGTHRLVWTQGTTRWRWLAVKLPLVFGVVVAGFSLLGLGMAVLVNQTYVQPDGTVIDVVDRWIWFDAVSPVLPASAAFAVALGAALGTLQQRTYRAMALTFVGYGLVRTLVATLLRPRYAPPLFDPNPDPGIQAHSRWLPYLQAGYYQPGDRFWTFQGIEAAVFLALAALLVGVTVYWVTRRVR